MTPLNKQFPAAGVFSRLKITFDAALYRARELLRAASKMRGKVIDVQGSERHSGVTLRLRYIGSTHGFAYWMDKIYGEAFTILEEKPVLLLAARSAFDTAPAPVQLLLGDLPWPYYHLLRGSYLRMPGWILQKTRMAADWESVVGQFRKNTRTTDMRKVRKYQLTYRLTRDPGQLEQFHDEMFEPYTRRRFGNLINGDSRDEIIYFGVHEGKLLQILHLGRVVGGVVLSHWQNEMHFLWLGLPEALDSGLADAALSAIYLFSLQQAYTEGCQEMDFSLTRPLLNNGIYHYKRKWGARLVDDWPNAEFQWKIRHFDKPVTAFFAAHPMIVRDKGELTGKILVTSNQTPDTLRKLAEQSYSAGLARMQIFTAGNVRCAEDSLADLTYLEMIDLTDTANQAERFTGTVD
jgi:hypothetical protein